MYSSSKCPFSAKSGHFLQGVLKIILLMLYLNGREPLSVVSLQIHEKGGKGYEKEFRQKS